MVVQTSSFIRELKDSCSQELGAEDSMCAQRKSIYQTVVHDCKPTIVEVQDDFRSADGPSFHSAFVSPMVNMAHP